MSLFLNAAPIDYNSEDLEVNSNDSATNPNAVYRKKLQKNKTIKKKDDVNDNENSQRVKQIMEALHKKNKNTSLGHFPKTESASLLNKDLYENNDESKYVNFQSSLLANGSNEHQLNQNNSPCNDLSKRQKNNGEADMDTDVQIEGYNNMNVNQQDYHNQYLPYFNNVSSSNSNKLMNENEIYKKLDYLIHLVEEMKDEKTSNVTEELVLYSFLGVFIIYIVDSFARAGKYAR